MKNTISRSKLLGKIGEYVSEEFNEGDYPEKQLFTVRLARKIAEKKFGSVVDNFSGSELRSAFMQYEPGGWEGEDKPLKIPKGAVRQFKVQKMPKGVTYV